MTKDNKYIKINQYFDKDLLKSLSKELENITQENDGGMEFIAKRMGELITLVRNEQDGELYI